MQNAILVLHLIICMVLVGAVLMQRSEGGALGMGGGGGGGLISGRGAADMMVNITSWVGGAFFVTSLVLAVLANTQPADRSVIRAPGDRPGFQFTIPGLPKPEPKSAPPAAPTPSPTAAPSSGAQAPGRASGVSADRRRRFDTGAPASGGAAAGKGAGPFRNDVSHDLRARRQPEGDRRRPHDPAAADPCAGERIAAGSAPGSYAGPSEGRAGRVIRSASARPASEGS
jgi:preprotein translocase subunit SecG